jgi:hypothetical protein
MLTTELWKHINGSKMTIENTHQAEVAISHINNALAEIARILEKLSNEKAPQSKL